MVIELCPQSSVPLPATINHRAFCIAALEMRATMTPELLTALARRYALLVEGPDGELVENPKL